MLDCLFCKQDFDINTMYNVDVCSEKCYRNLELRERLAELCHNQWSGWMMYLFSKGEVDRDGTWIMPKEFAERWKRQMDTTYLELSDSEKESDRNEADKFLVLFGERNDTNSSS